jgi:D-threo-aldose 1-dehydrogenase
VSEIQRACQDYGVPLAAAALQFSLRDRRIASTIVGISAPSRVEETLGFAGWPIPEELWTILLSTSTARNATANSVGFTED